mgnify:CR=1 FL=1
MKNMKQAAFGFIAGAMCMVSVTAFGAYEQITATLFQDVIIKVDGEAMATPSDQPILNYQGYTYVPLRFVSEALRADVNWDIASRVVDITSDKKTYVKEVPVEKIVYVEKGELDDDDVVYEKLPVSDRQNDHKVQVTSISRNESPGYTKVFLNIENLSQNDQVQLVTNSAKLTVDGEEIDAYPSYRYWDQSWETSYIEYDDEREGYLIFNAIPSDYEKVDLSFTLRTNDGETEDYTFHFINRAKE